jgi:hypothetical protein
MPEIGDRDRERERGREGGREGGRESERERERERETVIRFYNRITSCVEGILNEIFFVHMHQ